MNTVRNIALCLLLAYGGFMAGWMFRPNPPQPQAVVQETKEEKPPHNINWKTWYFRLFNAGEWEVAGKIGITTDNYNLCSYTLYLVDGDRWIRLKSHTDHGVKGCGAPQAEYRFFVTFDDDFVNQITRVPGKDARFVAVGLGNPRVTSQGMHYFNKKTGKAVDDNGQDD
jgi:hypothetical protein